MGLTAPSCSSKPVPVFLFVAVDLLFEKTLEFIDFGLILVVLLLRSDNVTASTAALVTYHGTHRAHKHNAQGRQNTQNS